MSKGGILAGDDCSPNLDKVTEKILDLRIGTDKEILSALSELSKLPNQSGPPNSGDTNLSSNTSNQLSSRGNLQHLIEDFEVATYKKFLSSFREVKDDIKGFENELSRLHDVCESMSQNLSASKQNSRNLIDEITKLENERKKILREKELAQAYFNAFQLQPEDLKILRGTDASSSAGGGATSIHDILSPAFFEVFEKILRIQSNIPILLNIGHQTTAVEIMDQMSLFQESALERIYRWAQHHCKHVEHPDVAEVLSKSLSYLQVRPMLLKYVLDEYCTHRRSLVVRSFIDALTGVGNLKGIELMGSTDPSRYVGDMLAWIHQACPVEKENLLVLLKYCNKEELDDKITTSLSTILDGVWRPLNVRMEQTLLSGLDCVVMNKIDILIQFYIATMEQAVPVSNLLLTLRELQKLCHQTFFNQLKAQIMAELGEYRPPGPDLAPPSCISSLLGILKDLLQVTNDTSPEHLQSLINMIVTPLNQSVLEISNRLGSPDSGVYLCNCLNEITKFLAPIPSATESCTVLHGQIEAQIDRLSSDQSSWLIAQLGIGHIYTILHDKINEPLSTVPGMDSSSLKIFVNKLDTVTTNPESVLLPQIIHVHDQEIKKTILRRSFRILVAIYKQVYDAVIDPKNQYPENLLNLDPKSLEDALCN